MYIYLFAILPIFYSIIIYLLIIFLIIYWLATVGDLLSATSRRRPLKVKIAEITRSTAENTYSTTRVPYRDILRQSKLSASQVLSASVGDLVGDLGASKKTRGHIKFYVAEYVYIHTCKTLSRHYHAHINF